MRFDDRLKTVMTQPVADAHDRTVRWRQLVDLLSRPHDETDPALLDAALTMVRTGMKGVARATRAATARSIAGRASDPRLLAIFASDRLEVAAPLLAAAPLEGEDWALVCQAASPEVAAFIRTIRGEVSHAVPIADEEAAAPAETEIREVETPSIGEMVARIERLKHRRDDPGAAHGMTVQERPAEMPIRAARLFRWECDASGQIGWVDGAPRGALIGRSLPADEGAGPALARAFADRLPFDDAPLHFPAPALAGDWKLSGVPAFSPVDGRFLGYRGVARRDEGDSGVNRPPVPAMITPDAEALRETIHEIKTPLNAIIGFAEIIDGQYLGPAHRTYRTRAAEIVEQARLLLSAIEDLDLAARVQRGDTAPSIVNIGELVQELVAELSAEGRVRIEVQPPAGSAIVEADQQLVGKLLARYLKALSIAAGEDAPVRVNLARSTKNIAVTASRPVSLAGCSEAQLLDPSFAIQGDTSSTLLGVGFELRLVRGLARLARGELSVGADQLQLLIPLSQS
ncbi:sensor histidine kinase [Sphingomonas xanthus]|uniref:histidine kinase n=1 Tax=Sphingomonas xanthus TaxID=2594473 RepID=A0A516INS2_9SPHN|nr:histidine kinase dimerization/phospho-acceptor domain-containing protein [Sphingomonas xanthus]QDP18565.1 HAMP domain-containing histidine kinase [Sphingomonas xanthus]